MFSLAAVIPSPPVLVPDLCGGQPTADPQHPASQVPVLREAVLSAVRALAGETDRWTIIGVTAPHPAAEPVDNPRPSTPAVHRASGTANVRSPGRVFSAGEAPDGVACFGADAVGTFLGYGADVRVGLSDSALSGDAVADPELPLPVLIGGWARGLSAGVSARAWVVDGRAPVEHCVAVGAMLRRELDGEPGPRGVLLVADGANTLSLAAPGYLDPRAQGVQERIDTALEAGDCAALAGLDTDLCAQVGVSGRSAYQVLAGLFDAGATGGALGAPVPGTREPDRAEISEGLRVELPGGRGVVASELARVETLYRAAPFGVGYYGGVWRPEQAT